MNVHEVGTFLETQGFSDEGIEEYLEHFGKKGMKWGVRSSTSDRDGPSNRSLNKESRQKDTQKHNKAVDKARGDVASGKVKADWKASKTQFKADKATMGSREARKIMSAKRIKLNETFYKSQEVKSGKETTLALVGTGLLAAAYVGLSVAGRRM